MTDSAAGRSATLGDACVRAIPRLLSKEEIRDFSRIDSVKFTLAALLEFCTVALAIYVSLTLWNPLTYVLAVVVIGSRINGMGALMHDTAHYRGYANRRLNDIVGEILAFPTTASMAGYRNSHFAHHRELNGDNDPDWQRNLGLKEYAFPAPRGNVILYTLQYLFGLKVATVFAGFHKNKETRDVAFIVTFARAAFLVLLIASSIALGFWSLLLLYWVVPLMTSFLAIRYIRVVAEHYAVEHENVLNESRTVMAPLWERWLIAPWGLNYHLEHHLFPGIPCFRLAEVHRLLMTRDPFPQLAHVTHGYFRPLLEECALGRRAAALTPTL